MNHLWVISSLLLLLFSLLHSHSLSSSSLSSNRVGNVVIFSATGRVGSSNLLLMFRGNQQNEREKQTEKERNSTQEREERNRISLKNIGEIFLSNRFPSRNLPPEPNSALSHPSDQSFRQNIQGHIRRLLIKDNSTHYVASVKFWHAWSNGVTIKWLARMLILHGDVTHFILIARNPVRITASEQYGNRYHTWAYESSKSNTFRSKSSHSSVCQQSTLAYHIGGRWMSQMAATHYQGFLDILSLLPSPPISNSSFSTPFYSSSISILGLSYEADILTSPLSAYEKIISFLSISSPSPAKSALKKGMACSLSSMLINYEELVCTLGRYDLTSSNSPLHFPLSWMARSHDEKNIEMTFERMMNSWRHLSLSPLFTQNNYLVECTYEDILSYDYLHTGLEEGKKIQMNLEDISKSVTITSLSSQHHSSHSSYRIDDMCVTGSSSLTTNHPLSSSICPNAEVTAVPADALHFCHLSLYRSVCSHMTVTLEKCYLYLYSPLQTNHNRTGEEITWKSDHSNSVRKKKQKELIGNFSLTSCIPGSYTIYRSNQITS